MLKKLLSSLALIALAACGSEFERFAPPANSISGRGAKVHPKILSSTPAAGATVSPVTGSSGTQIKVIFDMTMRTDTSVVFNTYVRDLDDNSQQVWTSIPNTGSTFTWSSTNYLNDTLTIQLSWVRWPENNYMGFDFDNNTALNLDDMTLDNKDKISFLVGWNPGRYKVVPTGQYACYRYQPGTGWLEEGLCGDTKDSNGGGVIGTQDYPAGQNGFIDPRNGLYGPRLYGSSSGGLVAGKRFNGNPLNIVSTNCWGNAGDACYPYTADPYTTLMWKTCSQGSNYIDAANTLGDLCTPASGSDYSWGAALNACASLNTAANGQGYAGRKDWRLPTIEELEGLIDYGARNITAGTPGEPSPGYPEAPAIDGYSLTTWPSSLGAFPSTPITKGYWSATGIAARAFGQTIYSDAYVVEFQKGSMGAGGGTGALLESKRKSTNRKKVRCVAGPAAEPAAQTLTPVTQQPTTQGLAVNAATFAGFEATPTFLQVVSATSGYDLTASTFYLDVKFNIAPNTTQAGIATNYCIGLPSEANFGACSAAVTLTGTSLDQGSNTYRLATGAQIPGRAYKVFVQTTMTSDVGALALANSRALFSAAFPPVSPYANNTFNVIRASAPTTTSIQVVFNKIPDAIGASNSAKYCVALITDATCAVPQLAVSNAVVSGHSVMLTTSAQTAGVTYKVFVTSAAPATDVTSSDSPLAANTLLTVNSVPVPLAMKVSSAASPDANLNTVQVVFDQLPDATQATTATNYCIAAGAATSCAVSSPAVSSVTLSGYTATLALGSNLTAGTAYSVFVSNVRYRGAEVVTDAGNKLMWQRCRKGVYDNPTCDTDGVSSNDAVFWNDGMNYCNSLNATGYAGYTYGWRAPTINELKSIANRGLFGSLGYAIDTAIFPTPNVLAEDFASSTNFSLNGDPSPGNVDRANYNRAWSFHYIAGFTNIAEKDNSTLGPLLKPSKKNIRCVRTTP